MQIPIGDDIVREWSKGLTKEMKSLTSTVNKIDKVTFHIEEETKRQSEAILEIQKDIQTIKENHQKQIQKIQTDIGEDINVLTQKFSRMDGFMKAVKVILWGTGVIIGGIIFWILQNVFSK